MLTREDAATIVREACEQLKRILPISHCWLYGSYSRGDFDEESDIDILMTADLSEEKLHAFRRQVSFVASRLSLKHDITVSITVKATEAFEKRAAYVPYYMNVLKEGISYAV